MRALSLATLALLLLGTPRTGSAACGPTLFTPETYERLLAAICSEGFATLDPVGCANGLFGSSLDLQEAAAGNTVYVAPEDLKTTPTFAAGFANVLSGDNVLAQAFLASLAGATLPLVTLNEDPCDTLLSGGGAVPCGPSPAPAPHSGFAPSGPTLNETLSDEQEGWLGCGPLHGGDCEATGIEPLAAHPALAQAWVGFDGSCASGNVPEDWHLANGEPQPGTIGYFSPLVDPPPGMRSPFLADGVTPNPDYDVGRDGSITSLVIPAEFGASAGQPFASEMAAVSFNLQLLLVGLSVRTEPPAALDQFDPANPYAHYDPADPDTADDRNRCSFLQPQHCRTLKAVLAPEPGAALASAAAAAALGGISARRRRRVPPPSDPG